MYYLRILKLLCTFVIELRNMFDQLNFQAMQDDLEKEIERKKKEIKDFLRVVKFTGLSQKEIEKRLDYLLDDLSRLMKKSKVKLPLLREGIKKYILIWKILKNYWRNTRLLQVIQMQRAKSEK